MDFFVIFLFALLIGLGIYRGFVREIFGLFTLSASIGLSIVVGKWIAMNFFDLTEENNLLVSIGCYSLTFMFFIIFFSIIFKYVLKLISNDSSSIIDKIFGGVIGFVKAYLICFFLYFTIFSFTLVLKPDFKKTDNIEDIKEISPDWLKKSKTYNIFFNSIVTFDHLIKKLKQSQIEEAEKSKEIEEKNDEQDVLEKSNEPLVTDISNKINKKIV
jgi:membrane protein required for colicin V production